jgi:hypothetical protein
MGECYHPAAAAADELMNLVMMFETLRVRGQQY